MDEQSTTTLTDDEILGVTASERCPETTTRTGRTPPTRMPTIPTRTPTTPTRTPTVRTPRSPEALERAIAPLGADCFLAEHWERRPLVVPRAEGGRFDDLLSVGDVEWLVAETAIRVPGFRLVKAGETLFRVHERHLLAALAVHGRRRRAPGARGVRARRDDRAPGLAPFLAPARSLLLTWRRSSATRPRQTRTSRRAARRYSRCTTTRTRCSRSRSQVRSAGWSTSRRSSCR